jgi:U3 small nucleolar RNA-associated protein 3
MPEEVIDDGNMLVARERGERDWERRVAAEEEMMIRLPITRKDKKKMKGQTRFANELDNLGDFGDLTYLESLDKKRSLKSIIGEGEGGFHDSKDIGGDEDVPRRQKKQKRSFFEPINDGLTNFNEENEYYDEIKKKKEEAKKKRFDERKATMNCSLFDDEEMKQDMRREINYDIMKNKGLTPHRKKEQRNPRVKHRMKYEKNMIKLKSVKSILKDRSKPYAGEETGIKKNLARSVTFK